MRRLYVFTILFIFTGIYFVTAQDLIVMRNGNIIDAKITEISQTEIRYKRFDHLDGPTIVVPAAQVLSIRYENGKTEIITVSAVAAPAQTNIQAARPGNTVIDQDRFIFGINANGGGAFNYLYEGSSGAGIGFEFGKGKFNSEINFMLPLRGFGFLATFNGFWPSRIGGFYLGGGFGYAFYKKWRKQYDDYYNGIEWIHQDFSKYYTQHSLTIGLNIGYKFVTRSGLYFRTGTFSGFDFGYLWKRSGAYVLPAYIKPDLAIGWTMR